jgi:hypothetical protein
MITGPLTMRELTKVVATVCGRPMLADTAGERFQEANCLGCRRVVARRHRLPRRQAPDGQRAGRSRSGLRAAAG